MVFGSTQAGNVFSFVPDISSARNAGSDIIKLLDLRNEIDTESKEGKVVESSDIKGHLRLENIHFRYPMRPDTCSTWSLTQSRTWHLHCDSQSQWVR